MKSTKMLIIVLILFVFTFSLGMTSASDNLNDSISGSSLDNLNDDFEDNCVIESSNETDDDTLSGNTIVIVADEQDANQVTNPVIQPAIDNANSGDTIILDGDFFHCHFTINKTLNIIARENTSLGPCPHYQSEGAGSFGIFYIVEGGSGTLIQGFDFSNDSRSENPFAFLIRGASNVTIKDCTINREMDQYTGIVIENSNNIFLSNLLLNNTINGIKIINSSNVIINDCIISSSDNQAILIMGNSSKVTIKNNRISKNGKSGINLSSTDHINILNNFIDENGMDDTESGCGIYVNANITKIIVKGNMFFSNALHAILYDYRVRNLNNNDGDELLTIVDNNYFAGQSSMILHHRIYIEHPADGDMDYDSENDVYYYVGNGKYIESKTFSYMQHAFIQKQTVCGFTHYTPVIPWAIEAPANGGRYNFYLTLSNISQVEKGIYQVSIVDVNGNIASDFSSFDVTFYLNNFSTVIQKENEIFKTVRIENGTATVDFRDFKDYYLESGNVITASFPGVAKNVKDNPYVQFMVGDGDIPAVLNNTQIHLDDLRMDYGSNCYLIATLSDVNGKTLANKFVSIKLNGKNYDKVTDGNGKIKLLISLNSGSYDVMVDFNGDETYINSSTTSKIIVAKATPKITNPTFTTYPVSDEYYKVKLTDGNGKAIANQKVTFKLNGKTYSAKTDKNGMAKVKISLTSKKAYSISISYAGNGNYKAISKTGKIIVKTGLKASKIVANNLKIKRNVKKVFSFKLTSAAGKAISKQLVTVKLNGKTYSIRTSNSGIAKMTVKLNGAKKYALNIKFLGNADFKAVSKACSINVVK